MHALFLDHEAFQLPIWLLRQQCELFIADPTLLDSPYHVQSRVRPEIFRIFLKAVKGTSATITNQNMPELSQLCTEFGFNGLANSLSAFRNSPDLRDAQATQARIRSLEEQVLHQAAQIAAVERNLNSETSRQEQTAQALNAALSRLSQIELLANLQTTQQEQNEQAHAAHSVAVEQLRRDVHLLQTCRGMMDSLIVSDFPPLFDEFRHKK
jgi:hypothetical protein